MIFATIGTQAPFDRFVRMVDEIAAGLNEEVIVQTIGTHYEPKNIRVVDFLPPDEFNEVFGRARMVIAHAGMGTILSALTQQKPLIIVPRLASLGEHRNDHQMATAMRLHELGLVHVAYDMAQLRDLMAAEVKPLKHIGDKAAATLINDIKAFVSEE